MDEIKKDYKNSAVWSFILGSASILLIFGARMAGPGLFLLLVALFLIWLIPFMCLVGLFLGLRGMNSSKKALAIIGIVLCGIGLIFLFFPVPNTFTGPL